MAKGRAFHGRGAPRGTQGASDGPNQSQAPPEAGRQQRGRRGGGARFRNAMNIYLSRGSWTLPRRSLSGRSRRQRSARISPTDPPSGVEETTSLEPVQAWMTDSKLVQTSTSQAHLLNHITLVGLKTRGNETNTSQTVDTAEQITFKHKKTPTTTTQARPRTTTADTRANRCACMLYDTMVRTTWGCPHEPTESAVIVRDPRQVHYHVFIHPIHAPWLG